MDDDRIFSHRNSGTEKVERAVLESETESIGCPLKPTMRNPIINFFKFEETSRLPTFKHDIEAGNSDNEKTCWDTIGAHHSAYPVKSIIQNRHQRGGVEFPQMPISG